MNSVNDEKYVSDDETMIDHDFQNDNELSLSSWGQDIMKTCIKPIENIIAQQDDDDNTTDSSLSPILCPEKCYFCTCDDNNDAVCICFRCRETIVVPPPPFDENDENEDNDGSWLLNHKRTADEVERLKNADHVQKKIRFIDGDELMQECMRSYLHLGIVNVSLDKHDRCRSFSKFRIGIFSRNMKKVLGKTLQTQYVDNLTHVIVGEVYSNDEAMELVSKWSGLEPPFPFQVVNENWLIEITHKKWIPDEALYLFSQPQNGNDGDDGNDGNDGNEDEDDDSSFEETPPNTLLDHFDVPNTLESEDELEFEDEIEMNNAHIIDVFTELSEIYSLRIGNDVNDMFKSTAYRHACTHLRKLGAIKSVDAIPENIWPKKSKMWNHVKEVLKTGTLETLEILKKNPKVMSHRQFIKIHGVGPKRASELTNLGLLSIEDLRTPRGQKHLSSLEKICLSCFEDLQERIPRDEVATYLYHIESLVTVKAPGATVICAGSYRRGAETCGDVDILIFPPKNYSENILSLLHEHLGPSGSNLFVYDLTTVRENSTNYMCIGKLFQSGSKYRRIDIKIYDIDVKAFALLAFTGCDYWNRSLRYFARKKGFSLSDKGLKVKSQKAIDYLRSICRNDQANATHVADYVPFCHEEIDVFRTLGLVDRYKEPSGRNGSVFS